MGKGEHNALGGVLLCAGAMHEVVRGPGAGELHTAVSEFKRRRGVLVLVTFHGFVIDEVSDIQKHLA